jgi:hypothetical protein
VLRIHRLQDVDLLVDKMLFEANHEVLRGTETADEEYCLYFKLSMFPIAEDLTHLHALPFLLNTRHLLRHQLNNPVYHWIKDPLDVLAKKSQLSF